ncbi:MAG: DUF1573 domain-containing protein [Bacteroidia bacterium]|nr:DUF1573 domain-containing protein [Bacteroidia bacterium]
MSQKNIFIFLMLISLFACNKKDDRQAEAEQIVTEWVGKTIQFPNNMTFSVYEKDTLLSGFYSSPYKILLYVDSTGCTSCKLKLYEWQRLIAEADTALAGKLSFVFCFQPKNKDELLFLFKRDRFNYPIVVDETNLINQLNGFPQKAEFQCFLLDIDNKVISVGNPTLNPKVWDLYKQIISGKINADNNGITHVEVINKEIQLDNIKAGKKQAMTFKLKNTGNTALVISDVKTSCGCTNADWEREPIEKGKSTAISADITLDETGYFSKTLSVYCNVENSPIILTVKGNVN